MERKERGEGGLVPRHGDGEGRERENGGRERRSGAEGGGGGHCFTYKKSFLRPCPCGQIGNDESSMAAELAESADEMYMAGSSWLNEPRCLQWRTGPPGSLGAGEGGSATKEVEQDP